jgi:hypothetical protein
MDELSRLQMSYWKISISRFTKNKTGNIKPTLLKKGWFWGWDPFVLINENSASASEFFRCSSDNDRGTIVGRRSLERTGATRNGFCWWFCSALDCCSILYAQADQFKSRIQMAMKRILKNQNLVWKGELYEKKIV